MHLTLLALVPFVDLVAAGKTSTRCYTTMTSKQVPCKTAWQTKYTPCVVTTTVTSSTTLPDLTITNTLFETTTSTTISTIATSEGFVAIQTSLPGSTYDGSQGSSPVQRRQNSKARGRSQHRGMTPWKFPKHVNCKKWQPSPKCQTTTVTSTATIAPSATSTTSTTVTVTVAVAATTVYAACATNNFASQYNGLTIIGGEPIDATNDVVFSTDTTIYDCCVSAITNPLAQVWGFSTALGCEIAEASTCSAQGNGRWVADLDSGTSSAFSLGNANCGEFVPTA